jgi:hypothetical protein
VDASPKGLGRRGRACHSSSQPRLLLQQNPLSLTIYSSVRYRPRRQPTSCGLRWVGRRRRDKLNGWAARAALGGTRRGPRPPRGIGSCEHAHKTAISRGPAQARGHSRRKSITSRAHAKAPGWFDNRSPTITSRRSMVQALTCPGPGGAGCTRPRARARLATRLMRSVTHTGRVLLIGWTPLGCLQADSPAAPVLTRACAHGALLVHWQAVRHPGTPACPPATAAIRAGSRMPRGQGRAAWAPVPTAARRTLPAGGPHCRPAWGDRHGHPHPHWRTSSRRPPQTRLPVAAGAATARADRAFRALATRPVLAPTARAFRAPARWNREAPKAPRSLRR